MDETEKDKTSLLDTILLVLWGSLGSLFVGVVQAGAHVFDSHSPAIQYFLYGVAGAALYSIYRREGLRVSLMYSVPLAAICTVVVNNLFVFEFSKSVFVLGYLCLAFSFIWGNFRGMAFGKFILLGLACVLFETLRTPIVGFFDSAVDIADTTKANAVLRGVMGAGLGLGIEVTEFVLRGGVRGGRMVTFANRIIRRLK